MSFFSGKPARFGSFRKAGCVVAPGSWSRWIPEPCCIRSRAGFMGRAGFHIWLLCDADSWKISLPSLFRHARFHRCLLCDAYPWKTNRLRGLTKARIPQMTIMPWLIVEKPKEIHAFFHESSCPQMSMWYNCSLIEKIHVIFHK